MPNRYNVIGSDKKMRFSKIDMMFLVHLRGSQHNENRITIQFHFGSLVRSMCVFDRQVMKSKLFLNLSEHFFGWFMQTNPNKLTCVLKCFVNIVEPYVCYSSSLGICSTIDDLFHFFAI